MSSLVQHLHDFVRDVEPTEAEWGQAIDFLTRTGKLCTDKRQEFILLSDTLGISMLVDAINHRFSKDATESTVMGPFYVQNPPEAAFRRRHQRRRQGTTPSISTGPFWLKTASRWLTPRSTYGIPTLRASTMYSYPASRSRRCGLACIAMRKAASASGPSHAALLSDPRRWHGRRDAKASARHPFRPAHVHFMIIAHGYQTLVTHLFVDGDQYLDSDAVFAVKNSADPRFHSRSAWSRAGWEKYREAMAQAPFRFRPVKGLVRRTHFCRAAFTRA